MSGFKQFLLRGNLVDLAVGIVIGAAFTALVNALVADIITPLIAATFGKPNFGNLYFTINHSQFKYGLLINAIISFLIVGAVLYFLVVSPYARFQATFTRPPEPAPPCATAPTAWRAFRPPPPSARTAPPTWSRCRRRRPPRRREGGRPAAPHSVPNRRSPKSPSPGTM